MASYETARESATETQTTDRAGNSKAEKFQENVEYMDTLVGRIVSALDELGLRKNTIVLFTADNGTGGEGKGTPTELGARVPMIVNCPDTVVPPRGHAAGQVVRLVPIGGRLPGLDSCGMCLWGHVSGAGPGRGLTRAHCLGRLHWYAAPGRIL